MDDSATLVTETWVAQTETQAAVLQHRRPQPLNRRGHVRWIMRYLSDSLSAKFVSLDASKPWILYWLVHSLDLLGAPISNELRTRLVSTLKHLQCAQGGFAGGPGQFAHVATTYAAVHVLAIVREYSVINRETLKSWFMSLKRDDGSFSTSVGGEVDTRAMYCVLSVAKLLNLLDSDLTRYCAEYIRKCQSYEGGFGGTPFVEAHGGYTFCSVAAMEILGEFNTLDVPNLMRWLCFRQMSVEGGFQGRTNKLVDGCYSFWQGGVFPIIAGNMGLDESLLNRVALQEYILYCCQGPHGGLLDKPGTYADFYHTCYCLSGLSISQHTYEKQNGEFHLLSDPAVWENVDDRRELPWESEEAHVVGEPSNLAKATHPVHNIAMDHYSAILKQFNKL